MMDSIAFSPTSSGSMKLETPANVKVAYVFVHENPQSRNPVLHVLHLTELGSGEESLLVDQVRDGLASICGADYVKKLHISFANYDGDNHLCENVFIAIHGHTVSLPTKSREPVQESFAGYCEGLLTLRGLYNVPPMMDSGRFEQLLDDDLKFHYELIETIPLAGSPLPSPFDGNEIDEIGPRFVPLLVQGTQLESHSTLSRSCSFDDSTAASLLYECNESCTIPEQILDCYVPQPGIPSEPQTLESNYNPSTDVCREGDGYIVEVLFHGYPMDAELDTGSPYTIISEECLTSILESTPEGWSARLQQRKEPSTIKELEAYNGGVINIREQIDVILTRDKRKVNAKVLIQEGAPVPLLIGRNVLPQLGYKLIERVSDSADECQHYQVIRPVPTGPDKVMRYLGRCPKFLNTCNNEAGLCSIACKSKLPTKEPLLQSEEVLIDVCFD